MQNEIREKLQPFPYQEAFILKITDNLILFKVKKEFGLQEKILFNTIKTFLEEEYKGHYQIELQFKD